MQIEISRGTGTKKELEFLVSPTPGHQFLIKGLYSQANLALDTTRTPAVNFGKKPFDWMSDSQWQMLLVRQLDVPAVKHFTSLGSFLLYLLNGY